VWTLFVRAQRLNSGENETEENDMNTTTQIIPDLKGKLWTGLVLGIIATLFLLFDSIIHLMVIPPVVDAFNQLGLPVDLAGGLGMLELFCLTLYVIPRTSMLGAVLLTGYLGGAIAIQLRIHAPLFSTGLFPVYVGVLVWGGLYLREDRLRALVPVRH
jgi:hypothetical protein